MSEGGAAIAFSGKAFARTLTTAPGVYRMFAADGALLYVGKAACLKARVASYFNQGEHPPRVAAMVAQIAAIEVTATRTASEALLLENQLIKSLRPRYNVMLRDDKSYPYIVLTGQATPRICVHRGPRRRDGRYFGPYANSGAVRETLDAMGKLFRLRTCEDSVFRNRSRPCLQYQIGRCSAPCVNLIGADAYAESVRQAALFLEGRSDVLTGELSEQMERASAALEFEEAARLRDLLAAIRKVQARQYVDGQVAEMDVLACAIEQGAACVLLLSFRDGMNHGTRAFFPKLNGASGEDEVLSAFIAQYYGEHPPPRELVLGHAASDADLLEAALSERSGRKVEIKTSVRADRARYLELAQRNAHLALAQQLGSSASRHARLLALQELLKLPMPPRRMECFDISHTMGEATVASCVVFDGEGPLLAQYRRFNIADIAPGDDYAAMRQALHRRFKNAGQADAVLPDVLLIDGGAGQLRQATEVLAELGVRGVALAGVAKGAERRPGEEVLIRPDGSTLRPGNESPALHLIQQLRDESHRFAISGHRGRRQKARQSSSLEEIPGVGPHRRASLLRHFGGLLGVRGAGVEDIARVPGIDSALAGRIYAALHGTGEGGAR